MRYVLFPLAFLLSWSFWLHGHIASIFMDMFNAGWWFNCWFGIYQFDMQVSADIQDFVKGKGAWWPWGEPITFIE